ncbi:unnamed protein product, partial [Hapterophycus canaliculatus]
MFRGWSRLCLHAASLSSAEGASAAACAVARAARAEAMEKEARVATDRTAASADNEVAKERASLQAPRGSIPSAERKPGKEEILRVRREHQLRWTNILVTRVSGERDKALLFRGWSRLCLHAASLSAAEGASASATACARAVRAEAMEKEAKVAAEKAATSAVLTAAREGGQTAIARGSALAKELELNGEHTEPIAREHQLRRAKMLITHFCRERDRALTFRGWSRLCLHAASLSAAEGASAAACAKARAARTEAMEKEAQAATEKAEAWSRAAAASAEAAAAREQAKRSSVGVPTLAAELKGRESNIAQTVREHRLRRMKMLISCVCGGRDRILMFRGWSRLCLHAASLCASEGASAAATAAARAARGEAMEKEAQAPIEKDGEWRKATGASSEVAASTELDQREATCGPISAAELELKLHNTEKILRETRLRRMKIMIIHIHGERCRALLFRGWSRLCMHASSISTGEGASATATPLARAARAETMEKEAKADTDKAEGWRKAAAASAEAAAARELAHRETAPGSIFSRELRQEKDMEHVVQDQQLRRLKTLIVRGCGERDRALMFYGWSRLCSHAASLSATKGASSATNEPASAARSEAMENKENVNTEKAAAIAEVRFAREQTQQATTRGSLLSVEPKNKRGHLSNLEREHQLCLMKMLGASPTTAALARTAPADAMEKEANLATEIPTTSVEAMAGSVQTGRETAGGSTLVAELTLKIKDTEQALQKHNSRRMKILITRMRSERDRALMFRGWSRLCLHAASLSAAEGASAAATALARAARAEAMEKEAQAAAEKAEAWGKAAAASAEVAAAREQA